MTVTREQIVAEARSWLGTPFRHQAQLKGHGCDCKGLIVGVARALELPEATCIAAKVRDYSHAFRGRELFAGLKNSLIAVTDPLPGDILAILWSRDPDPRHLAFVSQPGWIIHAYGGGIKRVSEVPLGQMRVHSAWTWPSLGEPHG